MLLSVTDIVSWHYLLILNDINRFLVYLYSLVLVWSLVYILNRLLFTDIVFVMFLDTDNFSDIYSI